MRTSLPLTYTGSNTDNLYVSGWKNGKAIKLKVKNLSCHGGITVSSIVQNTDEFKTSEDLFANKDELVNETVYFVEENGRQVRYLFFDNQLLPLDNAEEVKSKLSYGNSYNSYQELYNLQDSLADNTIYTVTDKGTVEQYLYKDGSLVQIGNSINEITEGSITNPSEISKTPYVEGGVIDYNMLELVNGDYRYKNHTEVETVISDMPNLVSGIQMFMGTSLQGFCGDLSSLKDGRDMFGSGCNLDEASIINIIDSIPDYSNTNEIHTITISHNASVSSDLIAEMTAEAQNKNWEVEWLIHNN